MIFQFPNQQSLGPKSSSGRGEEVLLASLHLRATKPPLRLTHPNLTEDQGRQYCFISEVPKAFYPVLQPKLWEDDLRLLLCTNGCLFFPLKGGEKSHYMCVTYQLWCSMVVGTALDLAQFETQGLFSVILTSTINSLLKTEGVSPAHSQSSLCVALSCGP